MGGVVESVIELDFQIFSHPVTKRDTPPKIGGEFIKANANMFDRLFRIDSKNLDINEKLHNLPHLKTLRKELRNNLTPAEAKLWKLLRGKKLDGRKFRRQHSVSNFILDFYCPSENLAIELDGQAHYSGLKRLRDHERGIFLEHYGIRILRFENKKVFEELPWVIDVIRGNFGWREEG